MLITMSLVKKDSDDSITCAYDGVIKKNKILSTYYNMLNYTIGR